MDLFDYMRENNMKGESPLAKRLRPTSIDEVVGQEHILGKDKLLYRAIKADKLGSIILYGPPGTGKTTLATTTSPYLERSFCINFPLAISSSATKTFILKPPYSGYLSNSNHLCKLSIISCLNVFL